MDYQQNLYDDLAKYAPRVVRSALMKGYLDSIDDDDKIHANFYCLYGNLLYVFENENSSTFQGILFLEGCTVKKINDSKDSFSIVTVGGKNYTFSVTKGSLNDNVSADGNARLEWMECIEKYKVISIVRKLDDQESDMIQLNNRVEHIEKELREAQKLNKQYKEDLIKQKEIQSRFEQQIKTLQADIREEQSNSRAIDMERKLLLRSRGIIPRQLPSWARDRDRDRLYSLDSCPPSRGTSEGLLTAGTERNSSFSGYGSKSNNIAKIWMGTWNVGAMEPFVNMDVERAYKQLKPFVPSGYDIYCLGLQDGVKESIFECMEGYLAMEGCRRIRLDSKMQFHNNRNSNSTEDEVDEDCSKIIMKSDSSLFGNKYTGIAIFASQKYLADIKIHGVHHFSPPHYCGKSGAVGAVMSILNRTIVFVNCKLDAKDKDLRIQQFGEVTSELGQLLGETGYHLNEQFHHILWCGSLNFSMLDISGNPLPCDVVVTMLQKHLNMTLYDTHDELNQEKKKQQVFFGYRESNPFPNFYPTSKKNENRPPLNYCDEGGAWVKQCYRLKVKKSVMKGGKVREQTPSYSDRVLYYSQSDLATDLVPEPVPLELSLVESAPGQAQPHSTKVIDNYQAVNDGECMSISDHSPVFGTYLLLLRHDHASNVVIVNEEGCDISSSSLPPPPSSSNSNTVANSPSSKLLYVENVSGSSKRSSRGNSMSDMIGGARSRSRTSSIPNSIPSTPTRMNVPGNTNGAKVVTKNLFPDTSSNSNDAAASAPPGAVAFSGGSLLPPGPYTIRITNIKVLWGGHDDIPSAVSVLFPLPFETVAGESFTDFFSESLVDTRNSFRHTIGSPSFLSSRSNIGMQSGLSGLNLGGLNDISSHLVTADCDWRREVPHSKSGTCLPLTIDIPKSSVHNQTTSSGNKVIPPLQMIWKGDEPLDKLHIAFRVKLPSSSFNNDKNIKNAKSSKNVDGDYGDLMEGHCAIGLEKLCKLALCNMSAVSSTPESSTFTTIPLNSENGSNVCVSTSVAQLLLRNGLPMHILDPHTLQREMVTFCCKVELSMQNEAW